MLKEMVILIFGTSTTWGAWDSEGGWADRLKKYCVRKTLKLGTNYYSVVYNLGISGNRTSDILKRFDIEVKSRLDPNEETTIIFEVGGNDSAIFNDKDFWTPPEKFKRDLKILIRKAKEITKNIAILGPDTCDDKPTNPYRWDKRLSFKASNMRYYRDMAEQVCKKEKIDFIDKFGKGIDSKKYLFDGLHFKSAGHKIIFEKVRDYLFRKKLI